MTVVINGTSGITFPDSSVQYNSYYGFKNRIINGAMVIDQRNAGASITPTNGQFTVDRWQYSGTQNSKFTAQQNAGSVTPPVGYSNYLGMTVAAAVTVGASDYFFVGQNIEGFNFADMAWGTANAKTITLSFQVYSSLTGTFGGVLTNSAQSRSYPFTYTISSANTWTSISVTIAGDTTGTWVGATNGTGVKVWFGLGVGSTNSGTAGAWAATQYISAIGATSVVGTLNATWYITGVQLEKGSTATSFDYRPYGTEFQLCQRYFYKVDGADGLSSIGAGTTISTTEGRIAVQYPVKMRASPTTSYSGTIYLLNSTGSGIPVTAIASNYGGAQGAMIGFTVASGLTVGTGQLLVTNSAASNYFQATAEL